MVFLSNQALPVLMFGTKRSSDFHSIPFDYVPYSVKRTEYETNKLSVMILIFVWLRVYHNSHLRLFNINSVHLLPQITKEINSMSHWLARISKAIQSKQVFGINFRTLTASVFWRVSLFCKVFFFRSCLHALFSPDFFLLRIGQFQSIWSSFHINRWRRGGKDIECAK